MTKKLLSAILRRVRRRFPAGSIVRFICWLMDHDVLDEKTAYKLFAGHGYYLLRKHFYLPIPDEGDLPYSIHSDLVGVEMNDRASLAFYEDVLARYKSEFNAYPIHQTEDPRQYYLLNGSFMAIDGNLYYSLIRHLKPKRVVEIGSGNSTLLAAAAILENKREATVETELVCIEPYPNAVLQGGVPGVHQLIAKKVQDVGLDIFESLCGGDILFIDSTHVLRSGGDVWWEYCEILPRLRSGVYVHIHDISLPKPYPRVYFDSHLYWNEQYVLQAFLTFNSKFEVIWPGNYLMTKYVGTMRERFSPEYVLMREKYPDSEPASFWMRVR
jgi:hypothetical protein